MDSGQVTLEHVEKALRDLGGEATREEIIEQVTKTRNGDYSHYLDYYNYTQTIKQIIQQHCVGYKKYMGTTLFEKTSGSKFRLANAKAKIVQNGTTVVQPRLTPIAIDIEEPSQPDRLRQETYRILRDTALAREVKDINRYRCQLCGQVIRLKDGKPYAEAHHVKPLGIPHNGPDVRENILCVCPNHHVLLDYGAIALDGTQLRGIGKAYIDYHNVHIFGTE